MRTKIIFEDADILVVQKPAGIAVQTAQVGRPDVVSELKNYLVTTGKSGGSGKQSGAGKPGAPSRQLSSERTSYLGIIHRLDQPVEGLLVFAKNPKAAAALSAQMQKDDFSKEYLAVVCGKPEPESGELVDYLIKEGSVAKVCEEAVETTKVCTDMKAEKTDAKSLGSKAQNAGSGTSESAPKRAALHYTLRETRETEGEQVTLLEIKLETGRFHQIRVQLSHAGYPILGDAKYGNEISREVSARAGIRNTALCAYRLCFKHPTSKKEMAYTVEPMGEAFKNLDSLQ